MSVWVVSTVTPFREVLTSILEQRDVQIGGDHPGISDLGNVSAADIVLIHVRGDGINSYRNISDFLLRNPSVRIIALISAAASECTRNALSRVCEAVLDESEPAEDLISVVQVAARGFRLSLDSGLTPSSTADPAPPAAPAEEWHLMETRDSITINAKPVPRAIRLSDREVDVLQLVGHGESNKAIAIRLGLTEATVKVHLRAIFRKVDVQNRTQAALWLKENTAALSAQAR